MPIDEVVADANVLLSAVVGKASLRVVTEFGVRVHVARFNADEVSEYIPHMARKYRLPEALVLLQWRLLPLKPHPLVDYEGHYPQALRDMERDPEDAHALALARALGLPLWTNDRHFDHLDMERYSTAALLRTLEKGKPPAR